MNTSLISAESEHGPLCRSYVCTLFEALKFQVQSDVDVRDMQLVWAVGLLSDHRPHFLGSWHEQDPKGPWWRGIASDLHDRGVERLRIVIGADPVQIQAAMAPFYRYHTVLRASVALEHLEIDSTVSGHLPYVERALDVANALSRRLKRVAARNGRVANVAAAAALLRRSAESYISREWPDQFESVCAFPARRDMLLPAAVG